MLSLQQVKTVRFQNHSPPPKRHSLQPSPRLGSSPLHPRRALHPRAASLELSVPLTFPVRKSYSSVSAN